MPTVSIQGLEKTFEVKEGDVIYDALFDQGKELPHGCLSGSCGACRVEILTGDENLVEAGFIEKNTIDAVRDEFNKIKGSDYLAGKKIRLSCRAKVQGNITIKII